MRRRRRKFEGMNLREKLAAMNTRARVRYRARMERDRAKLRAEDNLAKRAVEGARLRNSPIDREEVSIHYKYIIRTLPASAVRFDESLGPRVIEHLVEPLVEELTREWADEGGPNGFKKYQHIMEMIGNKDFALQVAENYRASKPQMPSPMGARQCQACGQLFFYTWGHYRMRFCSDPCIATGQQAVVAEYVRSRAASRERGRSTKCAHCGGPMPSTRSTRKYCSGACRIAAFRAKPPPEREPIDLDDLDL